MRTVFSTLLVMVIASAATANADEIHLKGLSAPVQVYAGPHGIPHIYAKTEADAYRVLGYLHATDRLAEMDLFRRRASGTLAEIMGPSRLQSDILMRQLGIRRGCEALWNSDAIPQPLRKDIEAYTAGVNAKIRELGPDGLPPFFKKLGYRPAPWTPVDCLVFPKYMGWDQGGTDDDLWFGMIVQKMGVQAAEELWPLDRPYEIPSVRHQYHRSPGKMAALKPIPGAFPAYKAAFAKMESAGWIDRGLSFGSNNWAVDGTKTASGKPMLCNDPHLGFSLPSIWYTCHICAGGKNVAGVTMPGSPIIIIGHNDHAAWGMTNMQSDAVDYFIETINPKDPTEYLHRGHWMKLKRISETIRVKGAPPHRLDIDYTIHGPIISRGGGKTITLDWTGLGPTKDSVAIWKINHAENLANFLAAADDLSVPALNLVYADDSGTIALYPCGALPLRLPGDGRIPMDGASGDHDWAGMIPRDQLPLTVNPPEHFVASANNRPAAVGYPYYLGWQWDPSYRERRICDMLAKAHGLTIKTMEKIQTDAYDKAAESFVPVFLAAVKKAHLTDNFEIRVYEEIKKWNYVAGLDTAGPLIWQRWLDRYQHVVWDDEWAPRGVKKEAGSWGFCGENHRDPMMEVLEYLTRDFPRSSWFDDKSTPDKRETRDDCIIKAFHLTVASLRKQFGDDLTKWAWRNINLLHINSLFQQADLGRDGGPVVGDAFTVNPGSAIGKVGGGASWRMIVDFGDVTKSVGVYPGGQSENPALPQYDDQMPIWAKGDYLPLNAVGSPDKLPADAKTVSREFVP